jgi:CRP/FNR family transcriptional regulator, cyclic AMP receptor protein
MDDAHLAQLPLFESLSKQERREVARHADEVDLQEGKHLVDEGDFSYEFFVIEEGSAEVLIHGERVAELGPGDFFGEMGLLEHQQRGASVVATSPMTVIVMTGGAFRQMAREMPAVGERIGAAVKDRCRALVS